MHHQGIGSFGQTPNQISKWKYSLDVAFILSKGICCCAFTGVAIFMLISISCCVILSLDSLIATTTKLYNDISSSQTDAALSE